MSLLISRKSYYNVIFTLASLILIMLMVFFLSKPFKDTFPYLLLVAGIVIMIFSLHKFSIAFPVFLVIRSSLDVFSNVSIKMGPLNLNIPAVLSLFITLMGLSYLGFSMLLTKRKISIDVVSKVFFSGLLFLFLWVLLGYYNFGIYGLVTGFREWIRLFSIFMIYILTFQICHVRDFNCNRIINCIFFSLPIPLIVGLYQLFFHKGMMVSGVHRIYATFAHPNSLALYMVLLIGLTLWKLRFARQKLFWILLLLMELIVVVNTFSINGIIMTGILFVFVFLKQLKKMKKTEIIILGILFLFVGALFSQSKYGQMRIKELKKIRYLSRDITEMRSTSSFNWRVMHWKLLINKWKRKYILGYGLHTSCKFVSPWLADPHSDYIRYLIETGLLGLIGFMGFFIIIGKRLLKLYKLSSAHSDKFLVVVTMGIFVSWLIGMFAGNFITVTAFQFYFWALLAVINFKSFKKGIIIK